MNVFFLQYYCGILMVIFYVSCFFEIYLYKYRLIRDFNIFLWVLIQYCHYFYTSNCSSFGHWELFQIGSCPLMAPSFLEHSLILSPSDTPGSSCVFPATILESTTPPRITVSLYWWMIFRQELGFWILNIYLLIIKLKIKK